MANATRVLAVDDASSIQHAAQELVHGLSKLSSRPATVSSDDEGDIAVEARLDSGFDAFAEVSALGVEIALLKGGAVHFESTFATAEDALLAIAREACG